MRICVKCRQQVEEGSYCSCSEGQKVKARNEEIMIKGVGPDASSITTLSGGRHSDTPFRMDLLPPHALLEVSTILKAGAAKYNKGDDEHPNWRLISVRDHLNHALIHITAYLAGDTQEKNHLAHAGCRILFAIDLVENPNLVRKES